MTTQKFDNIIIANPTLTTHGFGMDEGTDQIFSIERTKLSNCYDEAMACEEFLGLCKRTVKPHKALGSSHHFKHVVERYARNQGGGMYIPEGALIIAALHLGFAMIPKEGTTSVYLNISKKTKIDGIWIHCY